MSFAETRFAALADLGVGPAVVAVIAGAPFVVDWAIIAAVRVAFGAAEGVEVVEAFAGLVQARDEFLHSIAAGYRVIIAVVAVMNAAVAPEIKVAFVNCIHYGSVFLLPSRI